MERLFWSCHVVVLNLRRSAALPIPGRTSSGQNPTPEPRAAMRLLLVIFLPFLVFSTIGR